jgi:hypothetical protein
MPPTRPFLVIAPVAPEIAVAAVIVTIDAVVVAVIAIIAVFAVCVIVLAPSQEGLNRWWGSHTLTLVLSLILPLVTQVTALSIHISSVPTHSFIHIHIHTDSKDMPACSEHMHERVTK